MKKIFIIDGNSLLFRAYFATAFGGPESIMRTSYGMPTNAIFALSNMMAKLLGMLEKGDSIFVAYDADGETFRRAEFKDYKANRKPAPSELVVQFSPARELMASLNIMYFEEHGIEADDIAGTVAKLASKEDYQVKMFTSDKDYLQLIDKNITIHLLKKGLSEMDEVNLNNINEKYGFSPKQVIDFKALFGDTSDNLPGIPGIGEKTALKLIQEYGDLETIIANTPNIKGKLGEKIAEGAELGRECYKLATIKTDVDLPFELNDLIYDGYDPSSVEAFAKKYEFSRMLSKLPRQLIKQSVAPSEIEKAEVEKIPDVGSPKEIGLALDLDFGSYHDIPMAGIAISIGSKVFYETASNLKKDLILQSLLADSSIKKHVFDGKATIYALNELGIKIQGIENDLLLAAYLLDSSMVNDPSEVYGSFGADILQGESTSSLLGPDTASMTMDMASYALSLQGKIKQNLQSVDAYKLYREVEMPLMEVLAEMEIEGFPLDKAILEQYGAIFRAKKNALEEEILMLMGKEELNLNSPKQLAVALYDELGIKGPKDRSTSVDVLNSLKEEYPICALILEYRKYAKLIGTYIDGLEPHIKEDGKIHSYFNQAQTTTGRLSSSSPNLQNISARDEEGKQIRKAFYYPDSNYQLLSLDYGQIELRVMAALANCKSYMDVFESGRDVHTETAKRIFKADEVTPNMRRKAKAVNFAIIYGTSDFGLAEQIGGSIQEAHEIIQSFFETYPEIKAFLDKTSSDAERKGYVSTIFGRRRYLNDIHSPNYAKREAAKRAALNAPVQGSAADLIKMAMVKINQFLKSSAYKTKMVLQIHDELIFRVPNDELETIEPLLENLMDNALELPVRLSVEKGIGRTWYDAKD